MRTQLIAVLLLVVGCLVAGSESCGSEPYVPVSELSIEELQCLASTCTTLDQLDGRSTSLYDTDSRLGILTSILADIQESRISRAETGILKDLTLNYAVSFTWIDPVPDLAISILLLSGWTEALDVQLQIEEAINRSYYWDGERIWNREGWLYAFPDVQVASEIAESEYGRFVIGDNLGWFLPDDVFSEIDACGSDACQGLVALRDKCYFRDHGTGLDVLSGMLLDLGDSIRQFEGIGFWANLVLDVATRFFPSAATAVDVMTLNGRDYTIDSLEDLLVKEISECRRDPTGLETCTWYRYSSGFDFFYMDELRQFSLDPFGLIVPDSYRSYLDAAVAELATRTASDPIPVAAEPVVAPDTCTQPENEPPAPKVSNRVFEDRIRVRWESESETDRYLVYRSRKQDGDQVLIAEDATSPFFDMDPTLIPCATYYYSIQVCNDCGCSPISECETGRLSRKPEGPWNLIASQMQDGSSIRLTWRGSTDAQEYVIYRSIAGEETQKIATVRACVYTDVLTLIEACLPYRYSVRAKNRCGHSEFSPWVEIVPRTVLGTPMNLSARLKEQGGSVELRWDPVEFSTEYEVERAIKNSGVYELVARTADVTWEDLTTEVCEEYSYRVRATTSCSIGPYSTPASLISSSTPPTPANASASKGEKRDILLRWEGSPGATSYRVLRGSTPDDPPIEVGFTSEETVFVDTEAQAATLYWYSVEACAECGCSEPTTASAGYYGELARGETGGSIWGADSVYEFVPLTFLSAWQGELDLAYGSFEGWIECEVSDCGSAVGRAVQAGDLLTIGLEISLASGGFDARLVLNGVEAWSYPGFADSVALDIADVPASAGLGCFSGPSHCRFARIFSSFSSATVRCMYRFS